MNCARCGTALEPPPYSRRDSCPHCGADLHSCNQCEFSAPGSYNDCREPQAERVVDKERANLCDWYRPGSGRGGTSARDEAKARLDALFRKKP